MRDFRDPHSRHVGPRRFGWGGFSQPYGGFEHFEHHPHPQGPGEPPFPPPPPPPGGFPGFGGRGPFPPGFPPGWGRAWGDWARSGGRGHRHGGRGRGGGRARRGNVRAAILALLAERPMHGYEMIQEIGERSGGFWRPSPGSVYPTLQLLADEGLVSAEEGASGKRLYSLTEAGAAEAAKLDKTPPWEQAGFDVDPKDMDLRSALGQLFTAVSQVAQAASTDQKTRAVKAITEARAQLYLILAETGVDVNSDEDTDVEIDLDEASEED